MKKGCNPNDLQEGQEQSKKLYRSISESARRLDDAHSCAQHVADLFTPTLQIQRSKFQEYCERLIFTDPILFGRKAEELLWRKSFYDVISASKQLKKKEYTSEELCNIQTHINAGVGHYHHFIARLQYQYNLDIKAYVDFVIFKSNTKKLSNISPKLEQVDWAKQSVHRCLIYLGDLNRYKLEIYPNWDPGLAIHYYLKAVHFNPEYGIPHNQMGTLASTQNHTLDAVYHYLCCLACKYAFDGTENNLFRLFEKNAFILQEFPIENQNADCIVQLEPVEHIKRLITRFLFLTEAWYFSKKIADVYILCHQTNMDLQECFLYSKTAVDIPIDGESVDSDSVSSPTYITDDMIYKIVVICLLCISKVQKLRQQHVSTIIAFTLAVYSQLLRITIDRFTDTLLTISVPNSETDVAIFNQGLTNVDSKTNLEKKRVIRRRRKKDCASDDESDPSDVELDANSDKSSISEIELELSSSDNESGDESNVANGGTPKIDKTTHLENTENVSVTSNKSSTDLVDKIRKTDTNTSLDIIAEEKLLHSLLILSTWFISDVEIVKSCSKSTRSLLKQIIQVLNLINVDFSKVNNLGNDILPSTEKCSRILLPEDLSLIGLDLSFAPFNLDLKNRQRKLLPKEETVLRIIRLVNIGHSITKIEETGVTYDAEKKLFVIQDSEGEDVNGIDLLLGEPILSETERESTLKENESVDNKGQLSKMKHMGQLWLAAEVRALESRVKGKTSLSPYLVLDVDSLIKCTTIVKHLVNSKKFIVVVPSAVVSALDDLKKEKSEVRDAIRWLELQFHHGNRFCRAQRPLESAPLPLIKYPKKKDKEMFTYIQIIECCYYFAQQQKDASNLVTLLLGSENALSNCENREISYVGLAHSAGINLELVNDFYDKWKKNFKGKK